MKAIPFAIASCLILFTARALPETNSIVHFEDKQTPLGSAAVKVKRGYLVHTGSIYPERLHNDLRKDFASALDEMPKYLSTNTYQGNKLRATLVKLHVCVNPKNYSPADIAAVINERWPVGQQPAITVVASSPPDEIAVDGVYHLEPADPASIGEAWRKEFDYLYPPSSGVISPNRDIIHLSGRAASGELAEATSGTMQQLFDVLKLLGSDRSDVVQIKAFIRPISGYETVQKQIDRAFRGLPTPPVVYVEWTSTSRATEIELIAMAPDHQKSDRSVSYFTPPADKASPVFSRVARIHSDEVIFIGALPGTGASSGEAEVKTLFSGLERISNTSGTDLLHFAKATYYVSGDDSSKALNALRPNYYDPKRPPAASKVAVPSVGISGRTLLIDMIAGPK